MMEESYQVKCGSEKEYRHVLEILNQFGYRSGTNMEGSSDWWKYPCFYLSKKLISGNFSDYGMHKTISLFEMYDILGYKCKGLPKHNIYVKNSTELGNVINRLFDLGYGLREGSTILKDANQYKYLITNIRNENNNISANFHSPYCLDEYPMITIEELETKLNKVVKGEEGLDELIIAGIAKKVEQTLASLGIKCADQIVVTNIIKKEALKAGKLLSETDLYKIIAEVNVKECPPVEKTTVIVQDDKDDEILVAKCEEIEDTLFNIQNSFEDMDFDDALDSISKLKDQYINFSEKEEISINTVDIEVFRLAVSAHKERQEKLNQDFDALFGKLCEKFTNVREELDYIIDNCD